MSITTKEAALPHDGKRWGERGFEREGGKEKSVWCVPIADAEKLCRNNSPSQSSQLICCMEIMLIRCKYDTRMYDEATDNAIEQSDHCCIRFRFSGFYWLVVCSMYCCKCCDLSCLLPPSPHPAYSSWSHSYISVARAVPMGTAGTTLN